MEVWLDLDILTLSFVSSSPWPILGTIVWRDIWQIKLSIFIVFLVQMQVFERTIFCDTCKSTPWVNKIFWVVILSEIGTIRQNFILFCLVIRVNWVFIEELGLILIFPCFKISGVWVSENPKIYKVMLLRYFGLKLVTHYNKALFRSILLLAIIVWKSWCSLSVKASRVHLCFISWWIDLVVDWSSLKWNLLLLLHELLNHFKKFWFVNGCLRY